MITSKAIQTYNKKISFSIMMIMVMMRWRMKQLLRKRMRRTKIMKTMIKSKKSHRQSRSRATKVHHTLARSSIFSKMIP